MQNEKGKMQKREKVQLDFRGYKPIGFVNLDEDGRKLTKLDDFLRQ
jgi:hypothetical protein